MPDQPIGLCECGCGQPTKPARQTHTAEGTVRGQPRRFLKGHNRRRTPVDYEVDQETGCWVWLRARYGNGYAVGWDTGSRHRGLAHRIYYERHVGPIPSGLVIDHKCRNRACVNPDHLEAVTYTENNKRSFFGRDPQTGQMLPEAT
jgi:hypothetical protein